jgi:hypothetical protein
MGEVVDQRSMSLQMGSSKYFKTSVHAFVQPTFILQNCISIDKNCEFLRATNVLGIHEL